LNTFRFTDGVQNGGSNVHRCLLSRLPCDPRFRHDLGGPNVAAECRSFLIDAFHGNGDLADSVNHLLVVGFYLINVGYVALALRTSAQVSSVRDSIGLVCDKIGLVLLVLGAMHFFNLYIFNRLRR